tara:strand:+ start:300 stop:1136 length:837 start_codon:yes stop_codon:yes gene_type:complete
MSGISIIKWANSLGITEAVNGSWIEAIARHYGEYGNRPHIISIAKSLGVTEPVNGSWLQAISQHSGVSEGPWLYNMTNDGIENPAPPELDPCSVISGVTSDNIGPLGSSNLYNSWYKLYNYNYSGWLYNQSEIGDCKTITGIEIHTRSSGVSSWDNQRVYMGHITENEFPSSFVIGDMTISDLTLVWEGTFDFIYAPNGTLTLDFYTNFTYNGSDNLVFIIDDDSGTYSYSYPLFKGISHSYLPNNYMAFKKYQDQPIDSETTTLLRYNYRPNTKLLY